MISHVFWMRMSVQYNMHRPPASYKNIHRVWVLKLLVLSGLHRSNNKLYFSVIVDGSINLPTIDLYPHLFDKHITWSFACSFLFDCELSSGPLWLNYCQLPHLLHLFITYIFYDITSVWNNICCLLYSIDFHELMMRMF